MTGYLLDRDVLGAAENPEGNMNVHIWIDGILAGYGDRILPVDRAIADRWGEMFGQREANVMDTAVAATAIVHGLVVATRNGRDFRNRGVRLVDPFKATPSIVDS